MAESEATIDDVLASATAEAATAPYLSQSKGSLIYLGSHIFAS
jgi:hypothetical protein